MLMSGKRNLIILFIVINLLSLLCLFLLKYKIINNKICSINNKTILLIGDSQDRGTVNYLCNKLNGTMKKYYVFDNVTQGNLEGHTHVCNINNSNTYIITLFHFGIFPKNIESKKKHIDISMEYVNILDRISTLNNILKYYEIDQIDIIVLSSNLWDLLNYEEDNSENFVEYIKLRNNYLFNDVINYIKFNLEPKKIVYRTTPIPNQPDYAILSSLVVSYINYNDINYLPNGIGFLDLENNMPQNYLSLDNFHMKLFN